jgi:hypothetical protein
MLWKITQELQQLKKSHFEAAHARMISDAAEFMGMTQKDYVGTYITKSRYRVHNPIEHIRIRRTGHYRKTVDNTLKLLNLFQKLSGH